MEPQKDEQQPTVDNNAQQPVNEFTPKQIDINSDDGMITNTPQDASQSMPVGVSGEEAATTSSDLNGSSTAQQVSSQDSSQDVVNNDALTTNEEKPKVEEEKNDNPLAVPTQPKPKSKVPKIAIFLAILVAISLAGIAAYIFIGEQKEDSSSNNSVNTTSEQQQNQPQPITSDEIDQTVNQIDQDLNKTTSDEDLPTSESVSDQSLNLQ